MSLVERVNSLIVEIMIFTELSRKNQKNKEGSVAL